MTAEGVARLFRILTGLLLASDSLWGGSVSSSGWVLGTKSGGEEEKCWSADASGEWFDKSFVTNH